MLSHLNSRQLHEIDGGCLGAAIDHAIKQIVEDMENRSGVTKDRTLTITLTFKPESTQQGALDRVALKADVKSKIPTMRSNMIQCARHGEGLVFQGLPRTDPNQRTLSELGEEGA